MIRIDMGITQRVHKISRLESCHVSDHSSQKSITGNIEWNSCNKKINPIISWFANCNIKIFISIHISYLVQYQQTFDITDSSTLDSWDPHKTAPNSDKGATPFVEYQKDSKQS